MIWLIGAMIVVRYEVRSFDEREEEEEEERVKGICDFEMNYGIVLYWISGTARCSVFRYRLMKILISIQTRTQHDGG